MVIRRRPFNANAKLSAASLGQNGLRSPPSSLLEGKHKITNFLNGQCMGLFGDSMNLQHEQPYLSKSPSAVLQNNARF